MDSYTLDQLDTAEPQGFHALMRFVRVVIRHRMILIGLIAAGAFLGAIRYRKIPKQYEATAKLLIRQTSSDPKTQSSRSAQGALASYRQLLLSDTVLNASVERMESLPPELAGTQDRALWPIILRDMLNVSFDSDQHVLDIHCRSTQPEATVNVIRALRDASEIYMEEYQQNLSETLRVKLEDDLAKVRQQLQNKEQELLEARRACGDIAINEGSTESHPKVQRASHLNRQLIEVRTRKFELMSSLESAKQLVASGADLTNAIQKLAAIVGEDVLNQLPGLGVLTKEEIAKLESDLETMQADLAALRRHYGSGHAEIIRRTARIEARKRVIATARQSLQQRLTAGMRDPRVGQWLIETLNAELLQVASHERALEHEYSIVEKEALELSDQLAAIELTEREVEALDEMRSSLLTRLNMLNFDQGGERFRVLALNEPRQPSSASYPVLSHILGVFCVAAAAVGLAVIYVIDLMDDRLRSPEEVREELGLPVLGIIRRIPEHEVEQCRIYLHDFPQTPHAECFRTLKTAITLSAAESRCIAMTSTEASEGKTTTTVNLAASYAQSGKRTLLIDADMRRPGLSRLLDVRSHGGLSEVLRAESDIPQLCQERVVSTDVPMLDVLPCGPRILNAGTLLSMPSLADVLDWATSEYDQVIVDCPPTLPVSDAAMVGRLVDGLLFLMNPDKTHRRSVARAVDQLRSMGLKILGIVANTSLSDDKDSYGYQYGYGYSSDYTYGHDEHDDVYPESASDDQNVAA